MFHGHHYARTAAAHRASQRANQAATWAAVRATLDHRRSSAMVLLDRDQEIGQLDDALAVAVGLETNARTVMLSARTRRHIVARRRVASRCDSALCVRYLSEAVRNPIAMLMPQRDPRVHEIVAFVPSMQRHVLLAIKLVPANGSASGEDEWWVRTAYPFGKKVMRKKQRSGLLRGLPSPVVA